MEQLFQSIPEEFRNAVDEAVSDERPICLQTYVLGDSGETKLKYIISNILKRYHREDLMELLYTAAKELIVNSTKAAIKRIVFADQGYSIEAKDEYEKGMGDFKANLTDKKFPFYRSRMKIDNLCVYIRFSYDQNRIILRITNNFPLSRFEEARIREKFINAKKFDNLFEYFQEHGDNTEGAGMGITMVEILLAQSGFDRHLFTIYSSDRKGETTARLEIPLSTDHKPRRTLYKRSLNVN